MTRRVRNQDLQINFEIDEELFHDDFSLNGLECTIKDVPQSDAFDIDRIHAPMLKNFGFRLKLRVLKLFHNCWHESTWPWNSFRVFFIRKPGKSNYASSFIYRPLTLSSHVGKLFEGMINRGLRNFLRLVKFLKKTKKSSKKRDAPFGLCTECN